MPAAAQHPNHGLKRIADRQIQHHIADIRRALEVPLGALRLPRRPQRYGDIDPKNKDRKVKAETGAGADGEVLEETGGENGARAGGIIPQRPDIPKIREDSPADYIE